VWLVEISELDAFRRTDVARIKQFLSLRTDRFRAAYGRHVKELPRCCVFFGTTNTTDYLQDKTGNRRFWPVDTGVNPTKKSVWTDLPGEVDQIWAEAVVRWQLGEPLFLKGDLEEAAKAKQEEHREVSTREGIIMDFLSRQVPEDWKAWSLDRRKIFWGGGVQGNIKLVDRDQVCALEVWCEAFGGSQKEVRYTDTAEINAVIEASGEWEKATKTLRCGYCGVQRGFKKKL
jgi:predicted P-loop ATPase